MFDNYKYILAGDSRSDHFGIPRQSMDTEYNRVELSLVELCPTYDIHILNGRFPCDTLGHYTCIANKGASVVDYIMCSSS